MGGGGRESGAWSLERVRSLAPFRSVTGVREIERYLERVARWTSGPRPDKRGRLSTNTPGRPGSPSRWGPEDRQDLHPENQRFNEEVLLPRGRRHFSINTACTGKAVRELGIATGRTAFTVDSLLHGWETFKFDLQWQNTVPIRLVVAGEGILIPQERQVVLRVDEASLLRPAGGRPLEGG